MIDDTEILHQQTLICSKYDLDVHQTFLDSFVGVALSTFNKSNDPINGLRYASKPNENVAWFVWQGEYSEEEDFFKPIHAKHLLNLCPPLINYLGLPPGWRFLFDTNNYEDVWYDEKLLTM